jgi:hypothetical protein
MARALNVPRNSAAVIPVNVRGAPGDRRLLPVPGLQDADARQERAALDTKVRAGVKPISREGARVAFKQLEAIAKVKHVEGRGWYGLRRIATDLAESATTDDHVKDRLGGWQDSETRKQIYQDRQTDELRAEAAKVRRALRLGALAAPNGKERATGVTGASGNPAAVDLDALVAGLTDEQKALLAAKINGRMGPVMGPVKKSPGPVRIPATGTPSKPTTSKERAMGLEPTTSSLGRRRKNKR